jgi:hypothetical protein
VRLKPPQSTARPYRKAIELGVFNTHSDESIGDGLISALKLTSYTASIFDIYTYTVRSHLKPQHKVSSRYVLRCSSGVTGYVQRKHLQARAVDIPHIAYILPTYQLLIAHMEANCSTHEERMIEGVGQGVALTSA